MKSILILLILCLLHFNCIAQDDLYISYRNKITAIDTAVVSQQTRIQYNLGKYYQERQIAWSFAGIGVIFSGVGLAVINYSPEISKYCFISSAVSGAISTIIFFDSDKWLKRAHLGIYPTGLRITF